MAERLAKVISVVFHPLLMPSYIFLGIIYFLPYSLSFSSELAWRFLAMVFITTFLIPFMGILLLSFTNIISNLQMESRRERFLPFLFVAVFYAVTTYLFWEKFKFPPLVNNIMLSVSISIIVLTVISLYWKISAHTMAVAGASGIYFSLLLQEEAAYLHLALALFFTLCGLVASARLRLSAHDVSQVWFGILLGFFLNCIAILILN